MSAQVPLPFLDREIAGRLKARMPAALPRPAAGELHWASILIARVHRADAIAATGEWNCICPSCGAVRRRLAEVL